jgi:hypothetical protein
MWLESQGAKKINPATGGKIPYGNFSVAITDARHSASMIDGGPVKRYFDFETVIPRQYGSGDARREGTPAALPSLRGARRRSNPGATRDSWIASLRSQ